MTAAKRTIVLEEDLDGGPADETVPARDRWHRRRVDLSDGGRIPPQHRSAASSRHGRTVPLPAHRRPEPIPGGQSTMRGREGPRPHMPNSGRVAQAHTHALLGIFD